MRVKTFEGRQLEEILPEIRAELGADAVVLSQKHVVSGGVGGFFGKRALQVVAADRMPSDDELVELEDDIVNGSGTGQLPAHANSSGGGGDLFASSAGGTAPRSLDLVAGDVPWDGSGEDGLADHLAGMFEQAAGQVVAAQDNAEATMRARERAAVRGQSTAGPRTGPTPVAGGRLQTTPYGGGGAAGGGFESMQLPARKSTVVVDELPAHLGAAAHSDLDAARSDLAALESGFSRPHTQEPPSAQAGRIAARAHQAIAEATREIEQQLAYGRAGRSVLSEGGTSSANHVLRAAVYDRLPSEPVIDERRSGEPQLGIRVPQGAVPTSHHGEMDQRAAQDLVDQARSLEELLLESGVDVEVARSIVSTVVAHRRPFSATEDLRDLARDLVAELMRVESGWAAVGRAQRIAVVGPSGAGKSSVVAKLAEGWRRMAGFHVGVISVVPPGDTVGAHEHTGDPLLRVRELDVRFVSTPEQMMIVLERMRECDVVLIDTPSSAYLDAGAFTQVSACIAAAGVDQVQVVIPLATSVREAESVIEHFRPMGVNRIVISKLDESRYAGQLLNFGFRFGLPIPFVTDGQRVPEDIRVASAREIAALIVPHHSQEL